MLALASGCHYQKDFSLKSDLEAIEKALLTGHHGMQKKGGGPVLPQYDVL